MSTNNSRNFRIRELARLRAEKFRDARRRLTREQQHQASLDNRTNENLNLHNVERVVSPTVSERVYEVQHNEEPIINNFMSPDLELREENNEDVNEEFGNDVDITDSENDIEEYNEEERYSTDSTYSESDSNGNNITSTDSEGDNDDNNIAELNEIEQIRQWALLTPPISHGRLEKLMDILRSRVYPDLPKTAKTFLGTTSGSYKIENFSENEEFVYFGIEKSLKNNLNCELHTTDNIELLINVDGLPLFKSSSKQLWPILCKVFDKLDRYTPFPVAIYCGDFKPSNLEFFFQKFIDEINILQTSRLTVNNRLFKVSIKGFICDRPARSLLKNMIGHGGYFACERCTVKGIRFQNRTIYPLIGDIETRTDRSFRNQTNPHHHLGPSPLLRIEPEIDLVHQFVLDSMHLLYLGVMKKLLECWLKGGVNRQLKMDYRHRRRLCELLLKIKVPSEFQRNTRSLENFNKFKSTELQFLLLYAGPIVFKNILPRLVYEHFLLLHAACRILCSNELALQKLGYAKFFLSAFVAIAPSIYTWSILIGTIHNLTHIADDVEYMQCSLPKISSYPFENLLGKIKKLLRNGNNPLAQLCRRFNELSYSMCTKPTLPVKIKILRQSKHERSGRIIIKRLEFKEVLLTTKPPENTVLLTNKEIFQIHSMYQLSENNINSIKISGITLRKRKGLYTYPCSSKSFDMWNVSAINRNIETYDLKDVDKKMVCVDLSENGREKLCVMPLLHM